MILHLKPWLVPLGLLAACSVAPAAPEGGYSFDDGQTFLKTYCKGCHEGKSAAGGFPLQRVGAATSLHDDAQKWLSLIARVKTRRRYAKNRLIVLSRHRR